MKLRAWSGLAALLLTGAGSAQELPTAAPALQPVRRGYGADQPEVLLQQRLFGLAHGVHLLVSGCLDRNENADAAQQAYDDWHARQRETLATIQRRLAAHHFGAQAAQAQWQDIARVLGLQETIYPALGAVTLHDACATLPQALTQARYDFTQQMQKIADDKQP